MNKKEIIETLKKSRGKLIKVTFEDNNFIYGVYRMSMSDSRYICLTVEALLQAPVSSWYRKGDVVKVEIITNTHAAWMLNEVNKKSKEITKSL